MDVLRFRFPRRRRLRRFVVALVFVKGERLVRAKSFMLQIKVWFVVVVVVVVD